jgi:hypothetical protein
MPLPYVGVASEGGLGGDAGAMTRDCIICVTFAGKVT